MLSPPTTQLNCRGGLVLHIGVEQGVPGVDEEVELVTAALSAIGIEDLFVDEVAEVLLVGPVDVAEEVDRTLLVERVRRTSRRS